jgi:hypothetical protein
MITSMKAYLFFYFSQSLKAVHAGHFDVQNDNIRRNHLQLFQSRFAAR